MTKDELKKKMEDYLLKEKEIALWQAQRARADRYIKELCEQRVALLQEVASAMPAGVYFPLDNDRACVKTGEYADSLKIVALYAEPVAHPEEDTDFNKIPF